MDNQSLPPVEHPRQDRQADPSRSVYPSRLDTPLYEQGQLPTQEQIFSLKRIGRTK